MNSCYGRKLVKCSWGLRVATRLHQKRCHVPWRGGSVVGRRNVVRFSSAETHPQQPEQRDPTGNLSLPTTIADSAKTNRTIVVALSGGVDSSVAAALLKEAADDDDRMQIRAVHMSNWNARDEEGENGHENNPAVCSSERDWEDATRVAQQLELPVQRQSFETDYWWSVFAPYLEDLTEGKMGNPDVSCNVHIKFGVLREFCRQRFGPETLLATGHYARLWHRRPNDPKSTRMNPLGQRNNNNNALEEELQESLREEDQWLWTWGREEFPLLLAAADRSKDQSYFLSGCSTEQLSNVIFPLGDFYKKRAPQTQKGGNDLTLQEKGPATTVREFALDRNLVTADKRESMGICFVGKRPAGFSSFMQRYLPDSSSSPRHVNFVDVDTGRVVATKSLEDPSSSVVYTAGQGARLSGTSERYFVVRQDSATSSGDAEEASVRKNDYTVWVCAGTHHPALYADSLTIDLTQMNWMAGCLPTPLLPQNGGVLRCKSRVRHLQPLVDCTVVVEEDSDKTTVYFDKPVRAIMPGQMAVFYAGVDGLVCLGGGPIASRGPSYLEQGRELPMDLHPSGANDRSLERRQPRK